MSAPRADARSARKGEEPDEFDHESGGLISRISPTPTSSTSVPGSIPFTPHARIADVRGMRTYLDGQLLDPPVSTLGEALDAARALGDGRLIVEAMADDAPVPPEHLADPPIDAPYASELHLTTADAESLVKITLLDAAAMLGEMAPSQVEAAHHLHAGRTGEAMAALGEIVRAWTAAHAALRLAESSGILRGTPGVEAAARQAESGNLGARLADVKRALQNRDWPALADALEYDLADEAARWSEMLAALADGIGPVD